MQPCLSDQDCAVTLLDAIREQAFHAQAGLPGSPGVINCIHADSTHYKIVL